LREASAVSEDLQRYGWVIAPIRLSSDDIQDLRRAIDEAAELRLQRRGSLFGARNLFEIGDVRRIASLPQVASLLDAILGPHRAVRALFFDKTEDANWPVAWHQDLSLAVEGPSEAEGWSNPNVKGGIPHAQAPAELLARMVTLRFHLDPCGMKDGPLRVMSGSHLSGRLSRDEIRQHAEASEETSCLVPEGGILLMRPLLLHASSPARQPSHRRVLHVEYAPEDFLPPGFRWTAALSA